MSDPVPMEIRRQRNEMLRILSHKKRMAFSNPFIGSVRPVLFEHSKEKGMMSGFTDNYIKVTLPEDVNMINQIADVKLGFFDESCESVISEYVFEKI